MVALAYWVRTTGGLTFGFGDVGGVPLAELPDVLFAPWNGRSVYL
jgi:hypothetical protein